MKRPAAPLKSAAIFCFWLACLLFYLPPAFFTSDQIVTSFRLFDRGWNYLLPLQLRSGQWIGRDTLCTYGPLYQLAHGFGLVFDNGLASIIRWHGFIEAVIVAAFTWALLSMTGASLRARALVYLLWSAVMVAPGEFQTSYLKPMVGVFPLAYGASYWGRGGQAQINQELSYLAAWFFTGPLLALYSIDIGMVVLLSQAITLAGASILTLGAGAGASLLRRKGRHSAAAAALGAAAFIVPAAFVAHWKQYLAWTAELVRGYNVHWSLAMGSTEATILAIYSAALILILIPLGVSIRRQCRQEGVVDSATLSIFAAGCYALVTLRDALTRSDLFHIWRATAPSSLVIGALVPCYLAARSQLSKSPASARPRWKRLAIRIAPALLAGAILVPFATTDTFRVQWGGRIRRIAGTNVKQATVRIADSEAWMSQATSSIRANSSDLLMTWPYGCLFNLLAEKRDPLFTIEPPGATTPYLEHLLVGQLRTLPDLRVLVVTAALAADGVSHFSRTPIVARYLLENFELEQTPGTGYCVLRRALGPRILREHVIAGANRLLPRKNIGVQLQTAALDCFASDLLVLRMRGTGAALARIGKPGRVLVISKLSDGTTTKWGVPLPLDGQTHDILLSPLELYDPRVLSIFHPTITWRSREKVVGLVLAWTPLDYLSWPPPELIEIKSISVLRHKTDTVIDSPPQSLPAKS